MARGARRVTGAASILQAEFIDQARSKKTVSNILAIGEVITANISSGPVRVLFGNLLRIRVTVTTYVTFGDDPNAAPIVGAVNASTSPAIELEAGTHLLATTGDFVRASANPARVELIEG